MKKSELALATILVFALSLTAYSASATEELDQYQTSQTAELQLTSSSPVMQSFIAGHDGSLTKAGVYLRWAGTGTTCSATYYSNCNLYVKILNEGLTVLRSDVLGGGSYTNSFGWKYVLPEIDLVEGEKYWIKVYPATSSVTGFAWGRVTSDAYSDGGYKIGSSISSSYDMTFKTYMDAPCGGSCSSDETCVDEVCVANSISTDLQSLYIYRNGTAYSSTSPLRPGDTIKLSAKTKNIGLEYGSFTTYFKVYQGTTLLTSTSQSSTVSAGSTVTPEWTFTVPSSWASGTYTFKASVTECGDTCSDQKDFIVSNPPSYTSLAVINAQTYYGSVVKTNFQRGTNVALYQSGQNLGTVAGTGTYNHKVFFNSTQVYSNALSSTVAGLTGYSSVDAYPIPSDAPYGVYVYRSSVSPCYSPNICAKESLFSVNAGATCTAGYLCVNSTYRVSKTSSCALGTPVACASGQVCSGGVCSTPPVPASFNITSLVTKDIYSVAKTSFLQGAAVSMQAQVKNTGTASGSVTYTFGVYKDDFLIYPYSYSSTVSGGVTANAAGGYSIPSTAVPGTYVAKLDVSPCSSPNICQKTATFTVMAAVPAFKMTSTGTKLSTTAKTNFLRGQTMTMYDYVQNIGTALGEGTTTFSVLFNGAEIYSGQSKANVSVSASNQMTKTYPIPTGASLGVYQYKAQVSPCASGNTCEMVKLFSVNSGSTCSAKYQCVNSTHKVYQYSTCLLGTASACTSTQTCLNGSCVTACVPSACGSNAGCVANACGCNANFGNCDASWANGCEKNFLTDSSNCGGCGNVCGTNSACFIGGCVCDDQYHDCNFLSSDGCEINTQTDNNNCGDCGHACGVGEQCQAGECVLEEGYCTEAGDCLSEGSSFLENPFGCVGGVCELEMGRCGSDSDCGPTESCHGSLGICIDSKYYEYLLCIDDQVLDNTLFALAEEGVSDISGGNIIGIPPEEADGVSRFFYLFDSVAEDGIAGYGCALVSSPTAETAWFACTIFVKAGSTAPNIFSDAHEYCKYIDEDNPFIMASGASYNTLDFMTTLKPARKAHYVTEPFTRPALQALKEFWDFETLGVGARDKFFKDPSIGAEEDALLEVCTPLVGYSEECHPVSIPSLDTMSDLEFPDGCEDKTLAVLYEEGDEHVIATACADSGKENDAYVYEYISNPEEPAYPPESDIIQQARSTYLSFEDVLTAPRTLVSSDPFLTVNTVSVEGNSTPGTAVVFNVDVDSGEEGDYLVMRTGLMKNFAFVEIESQDRIYYAQLPEQEVWSSAFDSLLFSLFDNMQMRVAFDWVVPSDSLPGERYVVNAFTKQCDPSGTVCGDQVSEKSIEIVV